MVYVVTYIEIQPHSTSAAMTLVREQSLEVFQEIHRENRLVMIQEWGDESALEAYETAASTIGFRAKLGKIHISPYDQRVHHAFAVDTRPKVAKGDGLFVITHVDVPPPRKDETEVLLRTLADETRKEDGNLRHDVFQQKAPRLNHFTVVEAWASDAARASHELKTHTRAFRDALGPMLGAPYDDRLYRNH